MSLAGGLVVAGRRREKTRSAAALVAPGKPAAGAANRSHRLGEAARGILWLALLLAACALGPPAVAVLVAPAAVLASVSVARATRADRSGRHLPLRAAVVAGPLVAAASLVIADSQSANLALTLVVLLCIYDCASYINGNGRGAGGALGVAAGLLSVAVFAVFVAAVLDPPFTGFRPWLVIGTTGLLAPVGVWLASRVPGFQRLRVLRRLDSMILAAPAWVVLVAAYVHR
jgi:hypothetical protein